MDLFKRIRYGLIRGVVTVGGVLSVVWAQAEEPLPAFVTPLEFHSVFGQYPIHEEQEVAPWRETNDTVEKIGGWQAYARQARMPDPVPTQPHAMPAQAAMDQEGGKP